MATPREIPSPAHFPFRFGSTQCLRGGTPDRRGEDFQLILTRYGLERLLSRLSQSEYCDRFILKGAMLFGAGRSPLPKKTTGLAAHRANHPISSLIPLRNLACDA